MYTTLPRRSFLRTKLSQISSGNKIQIRNVSRRLRSTKMTQSVLRIFCTAIKKLVFTSANPEPFWLFCIRTKVYISQTIPTQLISTKAVLHPLLLPLRHLLLPQDICDTYPVLIDISWFPTSNSKEALMQVGRNIVILPVIHEKISWMWKVMIFLSYHDQRKLEFPKLYKLGKKDYEPHLG